MLEQQLLISPMRLWNNYEQMVESSFGDLAHKSTGLAYWRDHLFVVTIMYILPLSLIALIPGVIISLINELYSIAIFDALAVVLLLIVAFAKPLSILTRKVIFIVITYALAIVLLFALGSYGPSLVYMLAIAIFMIIIFPYKYSFLSVFINSIFCTLYAFVIYYELFNVIKTDQYQTLSWIAISTNLLFLNTIFSILIPRMFGGMQVTIEQQIKLKEELKENQYSLENSLKKLGDKNKELEHFAYIASHDLQEPIRMIVSFLTLIKDRYYEKLDSRGQKYIQITVNESLRMREIVIDLLELSRIDAYQGTPEKVDMAEVMQSIENTFQQKIQEKKAVITSDDLPFLNTHKHLLTLILQNLIENALKYSKENLTPQIIVRVKENESAWQFSVSDNGIGIEAEYFEKIFIIFQRLHYKENYKGTGIGLYIVKKTIDIMGGRIWVESTVGVGSTFYFSLPKM